MCQDLDAVPPGRDEKRRVRNAGRRNAGRCHYSTMLLVNTIPGAGTVIMIFSRLTGSFQLFPKYVCPAFSALGFREDRGQRTEVGGRRSMPEI